MKKNKPFVITINRQLGCGGSFIGQQVSKELGISYVDHEIISEAAKQLSVLESDVESRDEKVISFWESFLQFDAFAPNEYLPPKTFPPTSHELFDTESSIIKRIATVNSAVIMGRCGFHILKDHTNLIRIFLHGDMVFRKMRVAKLYNVSEEAAGKMIVKTDKNRAAYCKAFTGKNWIDSMNYDLSLDTGKVGVDQSVDIILNYLKYV